MRSAKLSGKGVKSGGPPVFSYEFFILNHADIVSVICILVFMGLLVKPTHDVASSFIFAQYNVTVAADNATLQAKSTGLIQDSPQLTTLYRHGILDINTVMFYSLIWIVIHAVIQQYVWERTVRKLKLSKTRTSKYFSSGCLLVFYALSTIWGVDHIRKEGYLLNVGLIWEGFPHDQMTFSLKFFMLQQMAFWLHCYPELVLMRQAKTDRLYSKVVLYSSSLLIILGAYVIKLQRLAIILLTLHYLVETLFHCSRLIKYHGRDQLAARGYKLWRGCFVLARLLTVLISILTLWFGLGRETVGDSSSAAAAEGGDESGEEDLHPWPKQFNTPFFRVVCLSFVLGIQAWVSWTFLQAQRRHARGGGVKSDKDKE